MISMEKRANTTRARKERMWLENNEPELIAVSKEECENII